MIPLLVTSVVLQFLPDVIPMHHDIAGNTDRWGNKAESFIFPIIIVAITLFWQLLIRVYEKKAVTSKVEKEQMEAKSSAKFLCIVGICQVVMFGVMDYFILYSTYIQAREGSTQTSIDFAKISCALLGITLIILGNYMTRTKKNAVVGVRIVWSMYNDNTWRKSNRFGAVCIMIAGLLTVITTAFANGAISTVLLLIYILAATIITVVYAKKVYDMELLKKNM